MDEIRQVLWRVADLGITLWLKDDEVRFRCRKGVMTTELMRVLKSRRMEIAAELRRRVVPPMFRPMARPKLVRSFRQSSWEGYRSGRTGIESANGPYLVGVVDSEAFAQAFKHAFSIVGNRYSILHSSVVEIAGVPYFKNSDRAAVYEEHDLSALAEDAGTEEATRLATHLVWREFDLVGEFLYRGFGIRIACNRYILGIVLHHFISDSVSLDIIGHILAKLVAAHLSEKVSELPGLSFQYEDYLLVMNEWFESTSGRIAAEYWTSKLASAPPIVLPFEKCGHPVGWRDQVEIGRPISLKLAAMARHHGTTLFAVLLAVQYVLLYRYTMLEDVTVMTVTSGREDPILQDVVGYLADRAYCRTSLHGNPTFCEIIKRTWQTLCEAGAHSFYRFDPLQQELAKLDVDFAVPAFNFRPAAYDQPLAEQRPVGFWHPIRVQQPLRRSRQWGGVARYWLVLRETNKGIYGHFHHKGGTVKHLAESFMATLAQVVEQPTCRLQDFPVLPR